jgi:hypothetical protein
MMLFRDGKTRLSLVLLLVAIFATIGGLDHPAQAATSGASGVIIDKFISPDVDAKSMARMWFPDAGAGASAEGLAMVAKQIREMADGGMGGVEIAFLADDANYTNKDAETIGWGSENWRKILKQILETANSVDAGFKVDITLTAHWPPLVNNIDPNDNAASQEASYAYKKITGADIKAGRVDVPLPATKTKDSFGADPATFIFTDKLTAATIARVTSVSGNRPVFEVATLEDVTASTAPKKDSASSSGYAGHAAGIPDRAYCKANGLDYDADVISKFGPEPAKSFDGKIDADGNRKRMADWQYIYETDLKKVASELTASAGEALAVGDYVIFGSYYRGTGQVCSGGSVVVTYNRCYVTDYFSEEGVGKIFKFWDDHILDAEMLALLKENGGKNGTSLFEDSIEMTNSGAKWTWDLLDEIEKLKGYDAGPFAPILAMGSASSFDDTARAQALLQDCNATLGDLYENEHGANIKAWAARFNYTYRAQAYPVPGKNNDEAALALDVPEGDNGTSGDGVRRLSSAVNMGGGKMLSLEATTFAANINSKWGNIMKVLNGDFSDGINRVILHGTPFARAFNGFESAWPGWNFFKTRLAEDLNGSGFSSWNARQIWWEDAQIPTGYIARTQAVMQNGRASLDMAVIGTDSAFGESGSNFLMKMLSRGYSYNVMSPSLLLLEDAVVKNGVLAPNGGSFKALVITSGAADFTKEVIARVSRIAKSGLPVIFNTSDVKKISDATLKKIVSGKYDNVAVVSDESELLAYFEIKGITPAASYDQRGLEVSQRIADEGNYYYFNNDYDPETDAKNKAAGGGSTQGGMPGGAGEMGGEGGMPPDSGMPGGTGGSGGGPEAMGGMGGMPGEGGGPGMGGQQMGERESEGFKYKDDVGHTIHTTVTLTGDGKPYVLEAWSGEIIPVGLYTEKDGKITMDISLIGREATIVCVAEDTAGFPDAGDVHAVSLTGGEVVIEDGSLMHRADASGTYGITLSDNTRKTVKVSGVPEKVELSEGWDLKLLSYGPTEKGAVLSMDKIYDYSVDPTVSVVTEVGFSGIALGTWSDLPATRGQLTSLGVEGMNEVSGIGYYTKTFELPEEWDGNVGAYLKFDHNSDMIAVVTINGHRLQAANQISDRVDARKFLKKGTNKIEIKLDSTLQNRDPAAVEKTTYGLAGVTLVPYVQTAL